MATNIVSAEEKGCRYLYDKGEKKAYVECLKTNCDKGIIRACGDLGLAYNMSDLYINKKKAAEGITLLENSCDQKDGVSCLLLSNLYLMPKSKYHNNYMGVTFAIKGCNLGIDIACVYATRATLVEQKPDGSEFQPQYEQEIFKLLKKISNTDTKYFPYNYRLGMLYLYGKTVTHDTTKALQAFKKGCVSEEAYACLQLSKIYEEGKLVSKDLKVANDFKNKADKAAEAHRQFAAKITKPSVFAPYYY